MSDSEINVVIAEACGLKCQLCNNTGFLRKFGEASYAEIRNSNTHWAKVWPKEEPDVACTHSFLPNYTTDLNAMHEAEKIFEPQRVADLNKPDLLFKYTSHLAQICIGHFGGQTRATARQRAEAFLRTIGKWKDEV